MRKALYLLIPAILLSGACTRELNPADETASAQTVQKEEVSTTIPGVIIVQMDDEQAALYASGIPATKSGPLYGVLDNLGAISVERLYPDAGEWEPRHRKAGLHRWFRVTYDPAVAPATKAAEDLSAVPGIIYVEPERRICSTGMFNDPGLSQQWSYLNDGSLGSKYKAGYDINVVPVWENYTAGSSNVIVAVIDEGVQLDHPDLAAVTIPAGNDGSWSFVDAFPGGKIYPDDHGTHVAGTIAAVNNNGLGVCGVAGGRDGKGGVRILSCAFMHDNPEDPEHSYQGNSYNAMVWAADHGAVICNNSWGNVYRTEADAMADNVGAMGPAIDYFIEYAGCDKNGNQRADSPMKGGLVIFAAGNNSWRASWPAAYEKVIAVGAIGPKGARSHYSNFGDWVDICAPGGDSNVGPEILSTVTEGGYGYMEGTSMACPHVTGVAALIVSYFGGPGFTNEMLKERLLAGANVEKAPKYGQIGPLVDATGSFSLGGKYPPEAVKDVTSSVKSNSITLTWKVTSDPDDVKSYGYIALAAKNSADLKDLNPRSLPSSVKSVSVTVGTIGLGAPISATLSDLEFETAYYTTVIAYDYSGNYSAASAVKKVITQKNNPPVVSTDYKGDYRVKPFETLNVSYEVSDPDGHAFSLDVQTGSDAFIATTTANSVIARIVGNAVPAGKYTAHIVATDAFGALTDYSIAYEILPNHAPIVAESISNRQFGLVGESETFDLSRYIQDEDVEPLKYAVSTSEPNVAHPFVSGNNLQLTVLGYGLTTVSVTATDACGKSCSLSFLVLVRDESRPVDLYPNPVVKTLNIRPGTEGQIEVAITNKVGATVWSGTENASPFSPLAVDMSGMAGGTYYVSIKGAGIDEVYPVAKL